MFFYLQFKIKIYIFVKRNNSTVKNKRDNIKNIPSVKTTYHWLLYVCASLNARLFYTQN